MPNEEQPVNSEAAGNGPHVARIALRLPQFWRSNVRLWIAQCDNAFAYSGITSDDTKFSALVAHIDAETLEHVADIVLTPPPTDKYKKLSGRLISEFAESDQQKIKKLLCDLQLGDEKPSHLLRKMRGLAGTQLQDDFLQNLWLQRMPPHIQTVLSASSDPLDKLAVIADKVAEIVSPASVCATVAEPPAPTVTDILCKKLEELSLQVAELSRGRSFSRNPSRDRSRSHSRRKGNLCFYHARFGDSAEKCKPPCAFQKNQSGPSH